MIAKPVQIKAINPYTIWVKYSDNTEGQIDLAYLLHQPVFQKWTNAEFFKQVYIDKETSAIAWNENIEICPDNVYLKIKKISFEQWKKQNYATDK